MSSSDVGFNYGPVAGALPELGWGRCLFRLKSDDWLRGGSLKRL